MNEQQLFRKLINILTESITTEVSPPGWEKTIEKMKRHNKINNPFALAWSMKKKGYKPCHKETNERIKLKEKWDVPTVVSPEEKGKYKGKSKSELLKMYNVLKDSGPHKKNSAEYGKMRELAFAIRAKSNWGKIKEK